MQNMTNILMKYLYTEKEKLKKVVGMFQNIAEEKQQEKIREEEIDENKKDIKGMLKQLFTKQNILVYIVSFMLSTVSTASGLAPFGLAIFAATLSNQLPAGIVLLATLIGSMIGIGGSGTLTYLLTVLVFAGMVLIFKPWYQEEYQAERRKLGKYVLISSILVQTLQTLFKGFLVYDFFLGITVGVITYIFYKIFANSLQVISEYGNMKVFTVEEVVGASLMLAIAVASFGTFQILGFEVKTVLCILIVLVLGWKKGILIRRDKRYYDWSCFGSDLWKPTNPGCIICFITECLLVF